MPSATVEDYFLIVSRLIPYKRIDLAVQACTRLGLPLLIGGKGRDRERLEAMAGPTVKFLGYVPDEDLPDLFARCRAFIFPGLEDFGITPVQAQAAGRPVIAFKGGGALDTVIPGKTGHVFRGADRRVADAGAPNLRRLPVYDPAVLRAHAMQFDSAVFHQAITDYVDAPGSSFEAKANEVALTPHARRLSRPFHAAYACVIISQLSPGLCNRGRSRLMNIVQSVAERIIDNVSQVIIGKRNEIRLTVLGLLCQGHILIEDVPGVGKTMLARALARSIGASFNRIQFTPDMLPSDVTGVSVFNQSTREFEFRPGPIMSQIVLTDEINRATPKTQAALLEAMEEHQITVDGHTYAAGRSVPGDRHAEPD